MNQLLLRSDEFETALNSILNVGTLTLLVPPSTMWFATVATAFTGRSYGPFSGTRSTFFK